MDEESQYRTEEPSEVKEEERTGFLRPLPQAPRPVKSSGPGGPITSFLGLTMLERTRDRIVLIFIPMLVAIFDANIFGLVVIDALEESTIYMFVLPMLAAILIGLSTGHTAHSLFGGLLASVYFIVFFMLFLISPGFAAPDVGPGEFFTSGMVVSSIYFLFVVVASLLGSIIGTLMREFL
ncbi:MAG: hypothetical protein ACXADL_01760 [Candidatus Thorarchaeota archaeon]|jgi:hypothetical protein